VRPFCAHDPHHRDYMGGYPVAIQSSLILTRESGATMRRVTYQTSQEGGLYAPQVSPPRGFSLSEPRHSPYPTVVSSPAWSAHQGRMVVYPGWYRVVHIGWYIPGYHGREAYRHIPPYVPTVGGIPGIYHPMYTQEGYPLYIHHHTHPGRLPAVYTPRYTLGTPCGIHS